MADRIKVGQVTASLRGLAQRFAFGMLVLTAFAVMVIGKADTIIIERIRAAVVDVATPVLNVISKPVQTVNDAHRNPRHGRTCAASRRGCARRMPG